MRRPPQLEQKPLPLQENDTKRLVAAGAAQAREAVGEDAAGEERTQLALDEGRHAASIAVAGDLHELLQMVAHHGVQHAAGGVARAVDCRCGPHPGERMRGPCRRPRLPRWEAGPHAVT